MVGATHLKLTAGEMLLRAKPYSGNVGGAPMLNSEELASVEFKQGETIFEKSDPPNACAYAIESGRVAIKSSVGAIEVAVETLERGDFIGEIALIDDEPRSARSVFERRQPRLPGS